ncbi:MAG: hypothetical protein ABJP82_13120 [Hyphomicrobiales bacterium]
MDATWATEIELAELMLAKAEQRKKVVLTPETAQLVAHKLLNSPEPDPYLKSLSFRLESWDRAGAQIVELLAAAHSFGLIKLTYDAALAVRPDDRLMVRQGIRLVLDSGAPEPEGPANVVRLR